MSRATEALHTVPVPDTGPAPAQRAEARRPRRAPAPPAPAPNAGRRGRLDAVARAAIVMLIAFAIGVAARSGWYTPGSRLGYWLGVAGGSLMLVLLLYPLRKRLEGRLPLGPLRYWFAAHMACGILGPLLILLHCTLRLGSLNASIAFWSMVVVATSGLVGRFLYGQLHAGLYGRQRSAAELRAEAGAALADAAPWLRQSEALRREIESFDRVCDSVTRRGWRVPWALVTLGLRMRGAMRRCRVALGGDPSSPARAGARGIESLLWLHMDAARRAAQFRAIERVFALWHVLHIPLVFVLALSAIVHVLAVHMY